MIMAGVAGPTWTPPGAPLPPLAPPPLRPLGMAGPPEPPTPAGPKGADDHEKDRTVASCRRCLAIT